MEYGRHIADIAPRMDRYIHGAGCIFGIYSHHHRRRFH
jgi:hypothetical protein